MAYSVSRVFWVRLGCDNKQYPRPTTLRAARILAKSIFRSSRSSPARVSPYFLPVMPVCDRLSIDRRAVWFSFRSTVPPFFRFRLKPPPRLRRSPRVARRFVSLASSAKGARESRATLAGAPARRAPEAKRASRSRRGRAPRASSPRVASGGRPLARRTLTCLASLAETRDTRNRASSHLERVGAPHARLRGSPCAPGRARARPRRCLLYTSPSPRDS